MLDFIHFWNPSESAAAAGDQSLEAAPHHEDSHNEAPTESTIMSKLNQIRASLDYLATRVEELERSLKDQRTDESSVQSDTDVPCEGPCKQIPTGGTGDATLMQHVHWDYGLKHDAYTEGIHSQDSPEGKDYKHINKLTNQHDETSKGVEKREKFKERIKDIDVKMLDVQGLDFDEANDPFTIFAPISNMFDELKRIFRKNK